VLAREPFVIGSVLIGLRELRQSTVRLAAVVAVCALASAWRLQQLMVGESGTPRVGHPEHADRNAAVRHIPYRWIMRCIVIVILGVSGLFIWEDYPSQTPMLPPPSSGNFYYSHDVWIGAGQQNALAHAGFYAPGPTLIIHPTSDGWSGYLHFSMSSDKKSASGYLAILLPRASTVGRVPSPYVSVSVDIAKSEKLIWVYISVPRNTPEFYYDLPLSWVDPESAQHLGFGKTRYFLYIGNAYETDKDIDAIIPFSSDLNRRNGSATEDTPVATVTIEAADPHEVFTDYTQPDTLFSTPSELQYRVDAGEAGAPPGVGLFRTVSVTAENSVDSFYMQLDSNVFFVAIGFLLSEVAVLVEKQRRIRRIARPNNPPIVY
jgi:hypothetical protein